jgi:adenylosuccinate synthase
MNKFTAVTGSQWGDEGKGKVVDQLASMYDGVARYSGGPNAGHTIYHNDEKIVLHVIPSGILHPDKLCLITGGVILDLTKLVVEITNLRQKGFSCENLKISPDCHLILPYHALIDQIREERKIKIGTTKSGIGPCYADRTARMGIRIKDLFEETALREVLETNLEEKNPFIVSRGYPPFDATTLVTQLLALRDTISPYIADTRSLLLDDQSFLLEGAQGAMLDIDQGTYPFVTSSQCSYAGILAGTGLPARTEIEVIGVIKAYNTRVGTGPFPTEDIGQIGARIRAQGKEFGSTTGRPRRCGWIDIPQIKYAIEVSGADSLVMTKLDVLSGFDEIQVCREYRNGVPGNDWSKAEPIYMTVPGFTLKDKVDSWEGLPSAAKDYIALIETLVDIPIKQVSLGPRRHEIIDIPVYTR